MDTSKVKFTKNELLSHLLEVWDIISSSIDDEQCYMDSTVRDDMIEAESLIETICQRVRECKYE